MSQIIQTSSGPAVLTDAGNVVMAGDYQGIRSLLLSEPQTVKALVDATTEKVQAADPVIAKVSQLVALTDAESRILAMGAQCSGNIVNISQVITDNGQGQ